MLLLLLKGKTATDDHLILLCWLFTSLGWPCARLPSILPSITLSRDNLPWVSMTLVLSRIRLPRVRLPRIRWPTWCCIHWSGCRQPAGHLSPLPLTGKPGKVPIHIIFFFSKRQKHKRKYGFVVNHAHTVYCCLLLSPDVSCCLLLSPAAFLCLMLPPASSCCLQLFHAVSYCLLLYDAVSCLLITWAKPSALKVTLSPWAPDPSLVCGPSLSLPSKMRRLSNIISVWPLIS